MAVDPAGVGLGPVSDSEFKQQHPPSFYCPISQQCLHDPVVLSDGHTYERRHIEQWLQEHDTSPVSGAQLQNKCMFPNHALRNAIEEYFQQVFSVHRRAIRKTIQVGPNESSPSSNAALLRTVDALMQCSILVNADLSIELVLRRIMDEAKTLVGAEAASVFLVDRDLNQLYSTVNSTGGELRIPISAGIAGHVAATGEQINTDDAYCDTHFERSVDARTGFRTRSVLCVPIRTRKDGIIGVAQLINKISQGEDDVVGFTADDLQFLQVFASQAAAAIANSGLFVTDAALSKRKLCMSTSGSGKALDIPVVKPTATNLLEASLGQWEMDVLELSNLTDGKPLSTLCMFLFERLNFISHFDLDRNKLTLFFSLIERGYDDVIPYHNRAHAASVVHIMNTLMSTGGIAQVYGQGLSKDNVQLEWMGCLVAAAIHDFEHQGVNNAFLTQIHDPRSLLYNDQHVNENHHVAAAFEVLRKSDCNFLDRLPESDYRLFRKIVVGLVLSTDMVDNFKITSAFKNAVKAARTGTSDTIAFIPVTQEDALLGFQMAIKCADVGHLSLPWPTHMIWVKRLKDEYFRQGDRETQHALPMSFLMDRSKPSVTETQVGFFDHLALPLFCALADAFPATRPMLDAVRANYDRWCELDRNKAAPVG